MPSLPSSSEPQQTQPIVGNAGVQSVDGPLAATSDSAPVVRPQSEKIGQETLEPNVTVSPKQLQDLLDKVSKLRFENQRLLNEKSDSDSMTAIDQQSAKAVEINRHMAEAIFEQSHDAILVLDYDRCISANCVARQLLDCSREEFQQRNFFELLTHKFSITNRNWADSMLQQLASEGCVVCELRRDTPEGELWIDLRLRTIEAVGESKVLVVGHDISRLRKFQTELARSHDFLHHTINSVQQPLSVKSADLKYVLANQAFCELVNLPFDRIQGRTFSELVDSEAGQVQQLDEEILVTGQATVDTEWLRRPDGSVTTLSTFDHDFMIR